MGIESNERWREDFRELCAELLDSGVIELTALCGLRGDVDTASTLAWFAAQGTEGLAIETDLGRAFPSFQFTPQGSLRPELAPHVATLQDAGLSPWLTWAWLTKPATLLSAEVPVQILASNPRRGQRAVARYAARVRGKG